MCGGWVRVCDDESESEIKVVYSQTSEPSTKALAWESEGGEGLTKKKKIIKKGETATTIYKTPIRKRRPQTLANPPILIRL